MSYNDFMHRLGRLCRFRVALLLALAGGFSAPRADAAVFNWPTTPGWTAGQPTVNGPAQTVDYSSSGQAISVTIANTGATWNAGFPQVAANGTGFVNGGTASNGLILQPISETSNATHIQLTINFTNPGGVSNVQFQLWDIDATVDGSGNGFIDQISNLQALAVGGSTVYADTVSNAHTSNPMTVYNFITGSGAGLTITGNTANANGAANGADEGTVTISFLQPITQISFWYSNVAGGIAYQPNNRYWTFDLYRPARNFARLAGGDSLSGRDYSRRLPPPSRVLNLPRA